MDDIFTIWFVFLPWVSRRDISSPVKVLSSILSSPSFLLICFQCFTFHSFGLGQLLALSFLSEFRIILVNRGFIFC